MPKIDKVKWGNAWVDGQKYHQALIIGGKVISREVDKLKQEHGTDHLVADWEQKMLLSENPEVILVAHGWSGVLKVGEEFRNEVKSRKIELKIVPTPKVVKEYNRLVKEGKRVNALIHTTC